MSEKFAEFTDLTHTISWPINITEKAASSWKKSISILRKCNESDLDNLPTRRKKLRIGNGCKGSFSQYENLKYLQIWLLSRFPVLSEKCKVCTPINTTKE